MIFHCPLYSSLRIRFVDLFDPVPADLHLFMQQPVPRLAAFATACRQEWQTASAVDNTVPPVQPITP
jgi:hypothetical protein